MSEAARRDEDLGKDQGLIHEAVVTGRKVGAGKAFWAKLAHNEDLFRKVVAFVAEDGAETAAAKKDASKEGIRDTVTIEETETFRVRHFLEIVQKHLPGVNTVIPVSTIVSPNEKEYGYYGIRQQGSNRIAGDRSNLKFETNPTHFEAAMFRKWGLTIIVHDEKYLEGVIAIAEEFQRETGRKVTIEKEF
jgi:hypothetical protein